MSSTSTTTRRWDGAPETPADRRFFDLRESGYRGPIDHNGVALINPGPVETSRQADSHRVGASNHHHTSGSGETSMVRLGLDDTLHAVVQVTHEHGLPLTGADVQPGRVQVFTDAVDLRWWVRWLTDASADAGRCVVWAKATGVALVVAATREDIEWTVTRHVPAGVAVPILAAHDFTVTDQHVAVPAAAVIALAEVAA